MPTPLTDQALYDLLCVLIALLLGGFAIVGVVRLLRRTRRLATKLELFTRDASGAAGSSERNMTFRLARRRR